MRPSDQFPWELLKAECLRLVCTQLVEGSSEGQNSYKPGRKEDMVAFLRDVHERGVVKALEDVESPRKVIAPTTPQATPSKRRKVPDDDDDDEEYADEGDDDSDNNNNKNGEGYNTRYKGVKRVKVRPERVEPTPRRKVGRPRKSVGEGGVVVEGRKRGRPRKSVGENGSAVAAVSIISRPRGRPRKVVPVIESNGVSKEGTALQSISANGPVSKDNGRGEVFDGIVLVQRNKNRKEEAVGDDDHAANDEKDGSEAAVIAAVNGEGQGDLSSLGGSNKENEHVSATYTPDPEEGHEADIDADGEFEADAEI